jgi:hypothetical protein
MDGMLAMSERGNGVMRTLLMVVATISLGRLFVMLGRLTMVLRCRGVMVLCLACQFDLRFASWYGEDVGTRPNRREVS